MNGVISEGKGQGKKPKLKLTAWHLIAWVTVSFWTGFAMGALYMGWVP